MVDWVKYGALRWFGHVTRFNEDDFVKRDYEGRIAGESVRGRPPVKGINRDDEYWRERELVGGG